MDSAHDVVVIAYAQETEYLLRLAQKNNLAVPIIVLLDEMRDGRRDVTPEVVDLLLQSVDVLRDLLSAMQSGHDSDEPRRLALQKQLTALASTSSAADASPANGKADGAPNEAKRSGWRIRFRPHPYMLRTGNDDRYMPSVAVCRLALTGHRDRMCCDKVTLDAQLKHCGRSIDQQSRRIPDWGASGYPYGQ